MNKPKIKDSDLKRALSAIKKGEIETRKAADELGIGVRHMNRLMSEHEVRRPPGKRRQQRTETVLRRAALLGACEAFMKGHISKRKACEIADVSERTIERTVKAIRDAGNEAQANGG